jgi:hypothetical protein
MLKDSVENVLLPEFDQVYSQMRDIAIEVSQLTKKYISNFFRTLKQ